MLSPLRQPKSPSRVVGGSMEIKSSRLLLMGGSWELSFTFFHSSSNSLVTKWMCVMSSDTKKRAWERRGNGDTKCEQKHFRVDTSFYLVPSHHRMIMHKVGNSRSTSVKQMYVLFSLGVEIKSFRTPYSCHNLGTCCMLEAMIFIGPCRLVSIFTTARS